MESLVLTKRNRRSAFPPVFMETGNKPREGRSAIEPDTQGVELSWKIPILQPITPLPSPKPSDEPTQLTTSFVSVRDHLLNSLEQDILAGHSLFSFNQPSESSPQNETQDNNRAVVSPPGYWQARYRQMSEDMQAEVERAGQNQNGDFAQQIRDIADAIGFSFGQAFVDSFANALGAIQTTWQEVQNDIELFSQYLRDTRQSFPYFFRKLHRKPFGRDVAPVVEDENDALPIGVNPAMQSPRRNKSPGN